LLRTKPWSAIHVCRRAWRFVGAHGRTTLRATTCKCVAAVLGNSLTGANGRVSGWLGTRKLNYRDRPELVQIFSLRDIKEGMTSPERASSTDADKRRAAVWAASQIEDGMAVGLGSGTTSALVIEEVGRRVAAGLRITAIATSELSQTQALGLRIPMSDFAHLPKLDLTIDGADEVQEGTLALIKGHGGALLREKIVAMASDRLMIAVDPRKLVKTLGSVFALPVEIVPFGFETTMRRLMDLGFAPELRLNDDGKPYVTDGQHYIAHCKLPQVGFDAEQAAESLKRTVGVVEHGLFLGMASRVVIGGPEGIEVLEAAR
jgi:ribose 5-phosphate isomerase A